MQWNNSTIKVNRLKNGEVSDLPEGWLQLACITEQSQAVSFPNKSYVGVIDQKCPKICAWKYKTHNSEIRTFFGKIVLPSIVKICKTYIQKQTLVFLL